MKLRQENPWVGYSWIELWFILSDALGKRFALMQKRTLFFTTAQLVKICYQIVHRTSCNVLLKLNEHFR